MVCTLPSTRSLSKASREGDWRENMANADISASGKAISVSSVRASGMLAKPFRTKRKSASAERCLRPLGATIDIAPPHVKAVHRVSVREILSHGGLRKDNPDIKVITGFYRSPGIAGPTASDASLRQRGRVVHHRSRAQHLPLPGPAGTKRPDHLLGPPG